MYAVDMDSIPLSDDSKNFIKNVDTLLQTCKRAHFLGPKRPELKKLSPNPNLNWKYFSSRIGPDLDPKVWFGEWISEKQPKLLF